MQSKSKATSGQDRRYEDVIDKPLKCLIFIGRS